MAKFAVGQTYTYYDADGSVRVVENKRLSGRGHVWIDGRYAPPMYPSPLNVRVGDSGIKVWMVIGWLETSGGVEEMLKRHGDMITRDDVEAAQWYYAQHQDDIHRKLVDEEWIA